MKGFILGTFFILTSSVSLACEQAPTAAYDLQKINDALKSSAFSDEIQNHFNRDFNSGIKRIDLQDGDVRILLTNKCEIKVKVTYWSDDGGMCPRVENITAKTICH